MAEAATPVTLRDVSQRISVIHDSAVVSPLAVVGAPGEWHDHPTRFPAVLCKGAVIREFARIHAGCERQTLVGEDTLVMAGAHVGHDARVGDRCNIAPNAVIGGLCTIGNDVKIGIGANIVPKVTIGDRVIVGAGAVVTKDIPAGETWAGNPAKRLHTWKPEGAA